MPPGNPYRSQNAESHAPAASSVPAVYTSQSSTSLASSFQSSAASSMLAAAPPSISSQSDMAQSDHSLSSRAASRSSSPKNRLFPLSISPVPRSSSLAHMGQSYSRPDVAASLPATPSSPPPLPLPTSASSRLRRVWVGRRKKSEDITYNDIQQLSDKSRTSESSTVASGVTPASSVDNFESSLGVFKSKNSQQQPKSPNLGGSPPVPPPKPVQLQTSKKTPTPPSVASSLPEQSNSPFVTSPSISAAIHFINNQDEPRSEKLDVPSPRTVVKPDAETKQDWRKSDSTMVSYATIRPGALSGNRSPRPVSLAESSHSGHTIVPMNKRLSALIADPEFAMAEESDSETEGDTPRVLTSGRPSPASSIKTRNRRSASLNHGPYFGMRSKPTTPEPFRPSTSESSAPPLPRMSSDYPRISPSTSRDTPTLTKAAARGIIAPATAPGAAHSTNSNIRGRLAAWTAAAPAPPAQRPVPPPTHPRRANLAANPTFRQTAVSMTGSLAPVALGLGKRAAEKVHRVWGGLSSSSSTHSGYSSTSSLSGSTSGTPSSSGKHSDAMGRSASGQSINTQPSSGGWMRRTPNAPSGSWSVNSSITSSSTSDSDAFITPAGPNLGSRLRGPRRNSAGAGIVGGLVFGRRLHICVQETATDRVKQLFGLPRVKSTTDTSNVPPLEERLLPAIVVRCAQHINRWGLQEEGLFRISGRPAHVAKLRSEFDTGADFALAESDPSDLDPHAVSSIFKAYLRELPESLLTPALIPHFEAAMAAEREANQAEGQSDISQLQNLSHGTTLTVPRAGGPPLLRKAPSLSTLAMPSFAGVRAVSDNTLRTLTSLVARLPQENRDLLYTVVELIQATAAHHKDTKMPLGNLLLVFCPSLNMSPPLLRVLCEAKSIWDTPAQPNPPSELPEPSSQAIPALSATNNATVNTSVSTPDRGVILLDDTDYDSDLSDMPAARPRYGTRRGPIATMLAVPNAGGVSPYRSSGGSSGQDDAVSYLSALDRSFSCNNSPANDSSHNLPALSNSTDSLATPSTMSEVSSFQSSAGHGHMPVDESPREKFESVVTTMPVIASPADLPLPSSTRRPIISAPIPFPATAGSSPRTPVSPRKSLALLSFPPLGKSEPSSPQSTGHTWTHRNKRPSLTLLFTKRSASSLVSPKTDLGHSAPPDVLHMPVSLTPSTSQNQLPSIAPVLDTPISSSPLFEEGNKSAQGASRTLLSTTVSDCGALEDFRQRKDSTASSLFSTPQETPIADYFRGHSASVHSLVKEAENTAPTPAPKIAIHSSPSKVSLTPSITVGIEDPEGEDWAQSVLLEAQAKSGVGKSRWSVKEAIKKFEGHT